MAQDCMILCPCWQDCEIIYHWVTKVCKVSLLWIKIPSYFINTSTSQILSQIWYHSTQFILNTYCLIINLPYVCILKEHTVAATSMIIWPITTSLRKMVHHTSHSAMIDIICVLDDHLIALDSCKVTILSLLDCSVAFHLVLHSTLLHHLNHYFVISGMVLKWLDSDRCLKMAWCSMMIKRNSLSWILDIFHVLLFHQLWLHLIALPIHEGQGSQSYHQ